MLTTSMLPLRMLGLLMLMFSLCDAESRCPTEVTLDPPEVLAEYGTLVRVNCSSAGKEHDGMNWRVGDTDHPIEYDNYYVLQSLNLSDFFVTAECRIKWNETHECSQGLKINVYKNPETVTLFQSTYGAALESTYYEMQCDVDDVAPIHNLTLRWYKNNETIKTDYFTNITKRPVSESSNLTVSLNRGEKEAQFRCEAQLDFGGHASQPPVTSNVYTLSAHYAPVLKNKMEDVYLSEGEYAILNCEAEGDPAPGFRWSRDGVNLMDRTNELNISTATSAIYNCTATNYRGSTTKQIRVHVENPTPVPSTPESCPIVLIPAEIVVRFGDPTSATCNASTKDLSLMGWEATKGGKATNERVITWTVEKVDSWDEQPLCYINVKEMQCKKSLNIILYKTPDNVLVSAMDPRPMVEGREYRLNCFITNVAPLEKLKLIWYRGDETMLSRVFNDTTKTPTNVSFDLEITPNRADNRAHFRCAAELHLGPNGPALVPTVTSSPYEAVVHYAPVLKNKTEDVYLSEGEYAILNCGAEGDPAPGFRWSRDGVNLMDRTNELNISTATSAIYNCTATNYREAQLSKSVSMWKTPPLCHQHQKVAP
ncbi:vascular cell adhesion protein 1-like [Anoplopoma fimbria]|uniref:vascular cell adhesion protein 1-like n=1 Tax=Anoplopoma fimbria TaxID=229290 RepID=UPI0023ED1A65|nr:vascular cell adhesion protein 1-like [Anoplopoma fimbria]